MKRALVAGKRGRPPAGRGPDGKPEMTSRYPTLTISMKPATKVRLDAVSVLTGSPAWRIIDEAINHYVQKLPASDRKAMEPFVNRVIETKLSESGEDDKRSDKVRNASGAASGE